MSNHQIFRAVWYWQLKPPIIENWVVPNYFSKISVGTGYQKGGWSIFFFKFKECPFLAMGWYPNILNTHWIEGWSRSRDNIRTSKNQNGGSMIRSCLMMITVCYTDLNIEWMATNLARLRSTGNHCMWCSLSFGEWSYSEKNPAWT